ncbi:hypothetical protein SDC9_102712 [bioreactor metagenome]|uniref:Resolvase/invertase-type recombinase catalytic domain-containing protein n=1 Tax=bioreactor metagenome TaxID=1076179 RepID=A0A645B2I2_9ZZZZ|nr:recombinase family protein [Candidatus Metalachnospira sp.]
MKVGYVRCSTIEQNEGRQMKMMEEQKAEKIFIDKASGKNTDRKGFKAMMTFARAGDVVIVESISRIARNTHDLLSIVSELTEKQVEFVSLKESIDNMASKTVGLVGMWDCVAFDEVAGITFKDKDGIQIMKDRYCRNHHYC